MTTNEQEQAGEEFFSSTGDPGTSVRQDERLYHNAEVFYDNVDELACRWQALLQEAESIEDVLISRTVLRGIVASDVVTEFMETEYGVALEVAHDIGDQEAGSWLIYLGQNAETRTALTSQDVMINATTDLPTPTTCLNSEHVVRTVAPDIEPQLFELWSTTFGWETEDMQGFLAQLEQQPQAHPHERAVWFSGVVLGQTLVAAAMAERIDLPSRSGQVSLIESTEWRRRQHDPFAHQGYMCRALVGLNRQIAADTATYATPPLVYAECNFTSRSDLVGARAGFQIPDRAYAPQILPQNVTVNDEIATAGLRDFTFMYLPADILEELQ